MQWTDKTPTAGELSHKLSQDTTRYDALEVGYAITENDDVRVRECIERHNKIFDEDQYCIVLLLAEDPLIKGLMRRKWYGWLYLPSPRPNQTVFLYDKRKDRLIKRLWVLPNAIKMATLAESIIVQKEDKLMQAWSVAFYEKKFWEFIRYMHGIDMPSEHEFFLANREKLIEAGCKIPDSIGMEAFDFSKIEIKKVIDPLDTPLDQ